jgi:hypothetical protein
MVDFNKGLGRGEFAYNTKVGEWWLQKSKDRAHKKAYRTITQTVVRYFRRRLKREPQWIVDYAGGNSMVLTEMAKVFPRTRFIALDGSRKMLTIGLNNLRKAGLDADFTDPEKAFLHRGPQIRLVCTALPEKRLASGKADAVLFLFPNLNASKAKFTKIQKQWMKDPASEHTARLFSKLQDENTKKQPNPEDIYGELVLGAMVAANIQRLLKRGMYWFKIDYSNALRKELQNTDQWQLLFVEAAMDLQIGEYKKRSLFEMIENKYYRSRVIMDVYDQTKDPSDRKGGYMITVFRRK